MMDTEASESVMLSSGAELRALAGSFRGDSELYAHWPAERCATHLCDLSGRSGHLAAPMVQSAPGSWAGLPAWLAEPFDDHDERSAPLWWLAWVGWLEHSGTLDADSCHGVSYHLEVFRHWRPGMAFYKYPYLAFHPGLCKAYGVAACQQSARAIELLLVRPPDTPIESHAAPRPATTPTASPTQFVGSRNSTIYHLPDCALVSRINPANLERYSFAPPGKRLHDGCPAR